MFNDSLFSMDEGLRCGGFPRFSPEALADRWSDQIVDDAGRRTESDLVHSHQQVDRLFPTAGELRERGVDVGLLASCLQAGLIIREYFAETLVSLTVVELNGAFEHLLEGIDAHQAHPHDALDRAMHLQGCCGCRAA